MKPLLNLLAKSRLFQGALLGIIVALLILVLKAVGVFSKPDFTLLNSFYVLRRDVKNHENIALWTIYDNSVALSRWPWGWNKYAESFRVLQNYGAHLGLVMEDTFDAPGSIVVNPDRAAEMEKQLKEKLAAGLSGEALHQELAKLVPDYNGDFRRVLQDYPHAILSNSFVIPDHQDDPAELRRRTEERKNRFIQAKREAVEGLRRFGQPWPAGPGQLLQAVDVVPVTAELVPLVQGVGFNRIIPDEDGVVRRSPALVYYDGTIFFSQGVVAAAHYLGCKIEDIEVQPGRFLRFRNVRSPRGGNLEIPIDERGMMYINWTARDQHQNLKSYMFSVIGHFAVRDMARRMVPSEPFQPEMKAVEELLQRFQGSVAQAGLISPEDLPKIFYESLYLWFARTVLDLMDDKFDGKDAVEKAWELFEPLKHPFYGPRGKESAIELYEIDYVGIYESLFLNQIMARELARGKEHTLTELMDALGVEGNMASIYHLIYQHGMNNQTVMEILQAMMDADLVSDIVQLKKDIVFSVKFSAEDEAAYGKRLLEKKLGKSLDEIEKAGYLIPYRYVRAKRRWIENNYEMARQVLRGGRGAEVGPLCFPPSIHVKVAGVERDVTLLDFKDKAVFIGLTATGLNALNPTPYSQRDPMASLTPMVMNTILTGAFIHDMRFLEIPMVAFCAIVMAIVALTTRIWITLPLFILGVLAHFYGGFLIFEARGFIVPVITPVLALVLGFVAALLFQYWEQQREKRRIRGMFAAMVSPEVLAMMENEPEKFSLRGEKVEASMFSSDVSGFTTISEGVTAQELANILNLYLTPMSNLVMTYKGYVEKYEGDAIKADFGLPVADSGHAWKACWSALLQQEELWVVQRMLQLKYGVLIKARMGVNTGTVSAGNMGSENKMQYCALGEAVAMAEELEPSNKMWETWIAIGPETHRQSEDRILTRLLDQVAYAHVTQPVYEVLGWRKERFLEYWKGQPVPKLAVEGWDRIIPEKILAYHEYYTNKAIPGPFKELLVLSFKALEDGCIEVVKLKDRVDVAKLESEFRALQEKLKGYDQAKILEGLTAVDRGDIARYEKAAAEAKDPALKRLAEIQLQLRRYNYVVNGLLGQVDRPVYDEYERVVDSLEKNVVCFQKRIQFPAKNDRIGLLFAGYLKELLQQPEGSTKPEELAALEKQRADKWLQIKAAMKTFATKAQAMPEEYHRFVAEHCTVSEQKLKVVEIFAAGRKLYLERKWDEAEARFTEGLALVADDGPCATFRDRCRKFKAAPPPPEWDGTWTANW